MVTNASSRDLTDAVLSLLTGGGIRAGDGEAPAGGGWQGTPGVSAYHDYSILFPLPSRMMEGNGEDPETDEVHVIQLSSYGATREQCQHAADRARVVLRQGSLTVAGRNVLGIFTERGGAVPLEERNPREWQAADRYRIHTAQG